MFAVGVNVLIIVQGVLSPVHVVAGNSMAPNIEPDDGLILGSADPGSLQVGQVVVFADPELRSQSVVHRIVGIEQKGDAAFLTTKGDNNQAPDPVLIPASEVQGRVLMRLPGFGVFLGFVNSPYGFMLTVVCPILLLVSYSLARSRQEQLLAGNRRSRLFTAELIGAR